MKIVPPHFCCGGTFFVSYGFLALNQLTVNGNMVQLIGVVD